MDKIKIKNLEVFAKHGVYPEENVLGQKFLISAELYTDLRSAGKADDITKTLSYSEVCRAIKAFVEGNTFNLIETVAEKLAEELLVANPCLKGICLEVKKPNAPIAMTFETVSVEIERSRHTVYISLGSNIGDREKHLRFAVSELEKVRGCRVLQVSEFSYTTPYGNVKQDDFLNGCIEMETLLQPLELLELVHDIENKSGRVRDVRWGPRTLDLDIVFYDDLIMSCDVLRIPHVDMHRRDFVLIPLADIAPHLNHPVFNKTVEELLDELRTKT